MAYNDNRHVHKIIVATLLAVILLSGLVLRTWNLNFDSGLSTHPDERSTVCFIAPAIEWPKSLDDFGNVDRSTLNPMWNRVDQRPTNFTYGHFPLYLGILLGELLHRVAPVAESLGMPAGNVAYLLHANEACSGIAFAGRLLIALLDSLTILLVFLLGRRIFGSWAALLAAAFYAFAAQAIQLAHFFAMDPASTTFTVLAVLGGVQMVQERQLRAALLTGVAAGLAVSSKFSALPVLAVPVTAALLWMATARRADDQEDTRSQAKALGALFLAIAVMAATFFVTSPYAVLDWQRFIKATLVDQGQMVRGVADFPFTRQFRNTLPYIYFIQQQVQWGLWWPLGVASLAGTLVFAMLLVKSLFQLASAWLRGRLNQLNLSRIEIGNIVIWSWLAPYFGITGAFLAKFNRYMSAVLPFVILFAVGLLVLLWQWGRQQRGKAEGGRVGLGRAAQVFSAAVGTLVLVGAIFWSTAYVNGVYGHEHTWISASRWIYQNAPRGSVLLWELWDDALPKTIPGEPGMDMVSTDLINIDWSPYEEDTAEKYQLMKDKLRATDYVVYSSKRIYDSVDELPERYPMTNLYYQAMRDGRLGFTLAAEFTSPPRLFGWSTDDRDADESWSLYDHPQVSIFEKTRQLSDQEYDALFDHIWTQAVPNYRGKDSPISPFLEALGLGSQPGSETRGLLGALVALFGGAGASPTVAPVTPRNDLLLDVPLENLPVVDNYRWNRWASERPMASVVVWWLVVAMLGWAAWPICFGLFTPWLDRGYLFSRSIGWLLGGWILWILASVGILYNSVVNSWITVGILAVVGGVLAWRNRKLMGEFLQQRWRLLLIEEALFALSFGFFIFIRMLNPDIWQPWFGGEKFMEFAFLNGILRSPAFPPVDPHFAGGTINYYYFGHFLVAYLIKLTGIYAEVAFNLTIPLLFALTIGNAFAITHTAWGVWRQSARWQQGVATALLGPLLVALMGNLDGYGQVIRQLSERSPVHLQSVLPGVTWLYEGIAGLLQVLQGRTSLPTYDFWGPSRVIPATINEFPFWSFLFADLHPHMIGIPISILFIGALYSLFMQYGTMGRGGQGQTIALIGTVAFLLGALASVNLWELPTYFGLAILTLLVSEFRHFGRIHLVRVLVSSVVILGGALFLFLPFFTSFVNVGASGIGIVRAGDDLGLWLLLWGALGFIVVSWLLLTAYSGGRPVSAPAQSTLQLDVTDEQHLLKPGVAEAPEHNGDTSSPTTDEDTGRLEYRGEEKIVPEYFAPVYQTHAEVTYLSEYEGETLDETSEQVMGRSGVARAVGMSMRHFERMPRLWYLHHRLVQKPTLAYLLGLAAIPVLFGIGILAWVMDRSVLGCCLFVLAFALPSLWRRGRESDSADHLATMLAVTGVAILAGTQVFYLKDFLQGDDWYRMNTLFKFFNQVWVLWALAGAIALPRLWYATRPNFHRRALPVVEITTTQASASSVEPNVAWAGSVGSPIESPARLWWGLPWRIVCTLLLVACAFYPILGTPARVSQRFVGWVPAFGTLDGMAFMQHGRYSWPNDSNVIDLSYDSQAIHWLLDNVRGNAVVAESAEVDYYRAGGTRVASLTGLSGLRGPHVSEQRFGEQVGIRDGLHREFWSAPSPERTEELIKQLQIALIYVGQLERYQHPDGVLKLEQMASEGRLEILYQNDGVTIYGVPGMLAQTEGGWYVPVPQPVRLPIPSMGSKPLQLSFFAGQR